MWGKYRGISDLSSGVWNVRRTRRALDGKARILRVNLAVTAMPTPFDLAQWSPSTHRVCRSIDQGFTASFETLPNVTLAPWERPTATEVGRR